MSRMDRREDPRQIRWGDKFAGTITNYDMAFTVEGQNDPQTANVMIHLGESSSVAGQNSTQQAGVVVSFAVVSEVSPPFGAGGGGQPIRIFGMGFQTGPNGPATRVSINGVTIGSFSLVDDTEIDGTAPTTADGLYDVVVHFATTTAALQKGFVVAPLDAYYNPAGAATSLFQDNAGTVPALVPGQPVRLMKDLSLNANNAAAIVGASNPVLSATLNASLSYTAGLAAARPSLITLAATQWANFTIVMVVTGLAVPVDNAHEGYIVGNGLLGNIGVTASNALGTGPGPYAEWVAGNAALTQFSVKVSASPTLYDGAPHDLVFRYSGTDASNIIAVDGVVIAVGTHLEADNPGDPTAQPMGFMAFPCLTGLQATIAKFGRQLSPAETAVVRAFVRNQSSI